MKRNVRGTWNHRVMKHEGAGEVRFAIHEVHYRGGELQAYTRDPIEVIAESVEGLRWTLERMQEALEKPVLTAADFPEGE